ncbi:MAG: glycosyl hydrolase family protein, partial [Erysipelotrichia bacterium]|nr:glycosyl hydrolase family protein [Erysipelotrichia bacterium]
GMLVLGANGDYYAGSKTGIGNSHGRRTGSAIISRDYFGPGRFEVRAKIMPRFGGATAFWTYYNDGTVNHEIDIELNVSNDFHNSWFTNWLTESNYVSMDMKTPVLHNGYRE